MTDTPTVAEGGCDAEEPAPADLPVPLTETRTAGRSEPRHTAADGAPGAFADAPDGIESVAPQGFLRRLLGPVTAGLAVALVAVTVVAVVFGWKLHHRGEVDAASRAATTAAQQYAITLTSIDSSHLDADFTTVVNGATGTFKDDYSQSADQLKPVLLQAKSASRGHVVSAAVQSASTDRVVVLLFVDAEITNVTNPTPRLDRNRILMTMDRVGGRWLASKVELP